MNKNQIIRIARLLRPASSRGYAITASYAQKGIIPKAGDTPSLERMANAMPSRPLFDKENEVINDDKFLEKFVTFRDATVSDIIQGKSIKDVKTVTENTTVFDAIRRMSLEKIGALLVTSEDGKPRGIITERDYLTKVILKGLSSKDIPVARIMTPKENLLVVDPTTSAGTIMAIMTNKRVRHVPIIDQSGDIAGLISIGDVVRFIMVRTLVNFIDNISWSKDKQLSI
jgi:CBS domain-containing protein